MDECRHAEAESLLGQGDSRCFSKKCFNDCGIAGTLREPEVCTVNRISALFECGQGSESKAWASLVHIEAKCCGEVSQLHYLTEVDHSFQYTVPFLDLVHFNCFLFFTRLGQQFSCQYCPISALPWCLS